MARGKLDLRNGVCFVTAELIGKGEFATGSASVIAVGLDPLEDGAIGRIHAAEAAAMESVRS